MKATLLTSLALFASYAAAQIPPNPIFLSLASEPNNQGVRKALVVGRDDDCKDLEPEGFDNQASWAYVEPLGLGFRCFLYE
jgi:hypothetical protein